MDDKKNCLISPFFQILNNLGYSHFNNFHYFKTDTLFWSLTRLFTHYYRIIEPIKNKKPINRFFLENDIESFIIRQKIILNDIAYIIWQIFPPNTRDLKSPKGPTQIKKEMRYKDLKDFVENNSKFINLAEIFEKNDIWISEIEESRNGIIHYKSKAIIFKTKPDLTFTIINAAGTGEIGIASNDKSVPKISIFDFINTQIKSLWNFLNNDLIKWLQDYIRDKKMNYKEIGKDATISCIGIALFKEINNIE